MVITAAMLNNIESTITNDYYSEDIYMFTTSSGYNLNCNYNQIKAQLDAGKVVQIKFNNIAATQTSEVWNEDTQQYDTYTVTATFTVYDTVSQLMYNPNGTADAKYLVYLTKYGWYLAPNATTNFSYPEE